MNKARLMIASGLAVGMSALAHADPVDYGAELTTNLGTVNTIWGTVASIMIGVALVTVGVKFFRKTR